MTGISITNHVELISFRNRRVPQFCDDTPSPDSALNKLAFKRKLKACEDQPSTVTPSFNFNNYVGYNLSGGALPQRLQLENAFVSIQLANPEIIWLGSEAGTSYAWDGSNLTRMNFKVGAIAYDSRDDSIYQTYIEAGVAKLRKTIINSYQETIYEIPNAPLLTSLHLDQDNNKLYAPSTDQNRFRLDLNGQNLEQLSTATIAHCIHPTLDRAYHISGVTLITTTKAGTVIRTDPYPVTPPGFVSGMVVLQDRLYYMVTNDGIYYSNLSGGTPTAPPTRYTLGSGTSLTGYGNYLYYQSGNGVEPDLRRLNLTTGLSSVYYQTGVSRPAVTSGYQIRTTPSPFYQQDDLPYLATIAYINAGEIKQITPTDPLTEESFTSTNDGLILTYDLVSDKLFYLDGNDIRSVDIYSNSQHWGTMDLGTYSPTAIHYEWYSTDRSFLVAINNKLYRFLPGTSDLNLYKTFPTAITSIDSYIEHNGLVYEVVSTTTSIYILNNGSIVDQHQFPNTLLTQVKYDYIYRRAYYIYNGSIGYIETDPNLQFQTDVTDLAETANKLVIDIYSRQIFFTREEGTTNQELYQCGYDGSDLSLIKSNIVDQNSDLVIRIIPNQCEGVRLNYANFPSIPAGWVGHVNPINIGVRLNAQGISRTIDQSTASVFTLAYRRIGVNDGPITVSVINTFDSSIVQYIDDNPYPGIRSFRFEVDLTQPTTYQFNLKSADGALINDVLICSEDSEGCLNNFRRPYFKLRFNGIPRSEINIFNAFLKITYRLTTDRHGRTNDPRWPYLVNEYMLSNTESRLNTTAPTCTTGYTNTFWKQQGSTGLQTNVLAGQLCWPLTITSCAPFGTKHNVALIQDGDELELDYVSGNSTISRNNWVWAVPGNSSSVNQDIFTCQFGNLIGPNNAKSGEYLIQDVELFLLTNRISDTDTPNCAETFVATDPATNLILTFGYTNRNAVLKEINYNIALTDIYEDEATLEDTWDIISSTGHGTRGSVARWESFRVEIDTLDGDGVEQCTEADPFLSTASGNLGLGEFKLSGSISYKNKCLPSITIVETQKGSTATETQAIILPAASGGSWSILLPYGEGTAGATVPWGSTAEELQALLEALPNIGAGNVSVLGSGTDEDPFYVYFLAALNNIDLPLMEVDGSNLEGVAYGVVEITRDFTRNERQQLTNTVSTQSSFSISFNGYSTPQLFHNISLNDLESELCNLPSIGPDNVSVLGNTLDRESSYTGPRTIDFVNDLEGINVAQMTVNNPGYSLITLWNGGNNNHEIQTISIEGTTGTFTITITDPNNPTNTYTTAPISLAATAATVKAEIQTACASFMTVNDIKVTRLEHATNAVWKVEFIADLGTLDIQPMVLDLSGVTGGSITIYEANKGGGANEKQLLTVIDGAYGYYTLTITHDGVSETTGEIPFNVSAPELETILKATDILNDTDVRVTREISTEPMRHRIYLLTFNKRLGDLPDIIPNYLSTLLCDPVVLDPVEEGPYNYPIPPCDEAAAGVICRPVQNDDDIPSTVEPEPCCTPADLAGELTSIFQIERDMFDPKFRLMGRKPQVRDYMAIKNLRQADFVPYLYTTTLKEIDPAAYVSPRQVIVVIARSMTDSRSIARILDYLNTHPKIMPSRGKYTLNGV